MGALLVGLVLLGAPKESCEERCNVELSQCSERCGAGDACLGRCQRRLTPCTDACAKQADKAEATKKKVPMPCGYSKGKVVMCTPDEEKANRALLRDQKAMKLCRNADGDLAECPPDQKK